SLARLDCSGALNEPELGFSPIAFAQASAPREAEETPPLLRNRGDGEKTRWPSAARQSGPILALSFAFGGHEDSNLAPIASLSHRDVAASYDSCRDLASSPTRKIAHARPGRREREGTLHPDRSWASHAAEPHCHGTLDSKPRRPRQCADFVERPVLCPAGQRRAHHLGSNPGRARGPGLCQHARYPQRRSDRRLEMRHSCCPCLWRTHGAPALACRTHLPSLLPARRCPAACPVSH